MHNRRTPSAARAAKAQLLWLILLAACAVESPGSSARPSGAEPVTTADASTGAPQAVPSVQDAGPSAISISISDASLVPGVDSCGGATYTAKAAALEILVLFDNSASMLLPAVDAECLLSLGQNCPGATVSLWNVAIAELKTFVNDPRSSGISMALKYFGTECSPDAYVTPDVPIGALPQHAKLIEQSLANTLALAETATRPALEGALSYARKRALEPGYNARQIILLVTDGYPDEMDCSDNTNAAVSRIAAAGLAGSPAIPTYVFVTVPGLMLDEIAKAGGTDKALSANLSSVGALSAALNKVRDQEVAALPCDYEMPPEYYVNVKDPGLVNLLRDGKAVARVGSQAECGEQTDAWYYDAPAAPTRLLTCPATCARLKSAASVNVQLNCPTVVLN